MKRQHTAKSHRHLLTPRQSSAHRKTSLSPLSRTTPPHVPATNAPSCSINKRPNKWGGNGDVRQQPAKEDLGSTSTRHASGTHHGCVWEERKAPSLLSTPTADVSVSLDTVDVHFDLVLLTLRFDVFLYTYAYIYLQRPV